MANIASIKDKLKNQAKQENIAFQQKLTNYGLERAIARIYQSTYAKNFSLKGGILLYGMFDGLYPRATMDIDLSASNITNDLQEIYLKFMEIFTIDLDDGIRFDIESLKVKSITEFKEYHGVNVEILGYLDKTKIFVSIDIGYGDLIYPKKVQLDFPVLLEQQSFQISAYPVYTVITEKFEAIITLKERNSRFKDFYDIYFITKHISLDGNLLKEAIQTIFEHRNTRLDEVVAFQDHFIQNEVNLRRWDSFIKKKRLMELVSFDEAIETCKKLLMPVVEAIQLDQAFQYQWNHNLQEWK